ncbi:hypothetical protein [Salinibius halmophilus]|nr:hypothetical protein [Salinibius halmophilus]
MEANQSINQSELLTNVALPLIPAVAILLMGKLVGVDFGIGAWFSTLI